MEASKISGTQGVSEGSLLQSLGMIERRLTRILGAYWRIMAEKNPGWTDKVPRIEQQMDTQKTKKAANLRMPDIGSFALTKTQCSTRTKKAVKRSHL